jgi:hypothetical protein
MIWYIDFLLIEAGTCKLKKNDENIVIFTRIFQEQKTILSNGHMRDSLG